MYDVYVLWSYKITYVFSVVFMMHRSTSMGVIVQSSTNVVGQLLEKVVSYGANIKESCSTAHTQNEMLVSKNIKDFMFENKWLDKSILQLRCTYVHFLC